MCDRLSSNVAGHINGNAIYSIGAADFSSHLQKIREVVLQSSPTTFRSIWFETQCTDTWLRTAAAALSLLRALVELWHVHATLWFYIARNLPK